MTQGNLERIVTRKPLTVEKPEGRMYNAGDMISSAGCGFVAGVALCGLVVSINLDVSSLYWISVTMLAAAALALYGIMDRRSN